MRVKLASLITSALLLTSTATHAAPPQTLNYQGYLTSSGGTAVNAGVSITFRLYASASGGAALWAETQSVTVSNGNFSVVLGNTAPFGLDFSSPYFLGVQVGTDPEMTPRQPLTASPYALRAVTADNLGTAAAIPAGQITGSLSAATIPVANVIGAGAGGVSSVATGAGLTGGPITGSGTIGLAATQLLPTTACGSNQVARWNGSAWTCAALDALPAGSATGQVLAGSAGGPVWTGAPTLSGNLGLAATNSASTGVINKAGSSFIHDFGSENTFVGVSSGNFTLAGSGNTALGKSTLGTTTTGSANVAVGFGALFTNTTGNDNTATGLSALSLNTTGSGNTAVGAGALVSNTTGGSNTAFGDQTLYSSTTGNNNIAIGSSAGSNLTSGSGNIFIDHLGQATESQTTRIGTAQTRAFMAGVYGVTPFSVARLPVVIDAFGQLGTGGANVGTVTQVEAGEGLTGGMITSIGTIGLAATQLLPLTACSATQIPKWNGSGWACSADAGLPAGGVAGQVLVGSAGGPVWSTAPTLTNLTLPDSTSTTGNLTKNGLPFLHNFGTQNAFLGSGAGNFVMTGSVNTGMGLLTLASNTTGSFNTALGGGALSDNTTGQRNTAVGQGALTLNATGNFNTAVGQAALLANVDGGLNTAVGYSALAANSSGVSNTATGGGALSANTTGSNNAALGRHALMTNTGGSENVALGVGALMANAGGNENTAAGTFAMAGNSAGLRNTSLGRSALGSNSTGNDNIGIGYNGGGSLTTGSNNIAIGHPGNVGESATTRIGNAQTRAFIAGIRGVTPGVADGLPVIIDSNGQLGTAASAGGTGTVTSITAGAGLAGGTITSSGTISVDPASAILAGNFLKQGGNAFGATAVLGTSDSNAVEVHANGSRVLRLEPDGVSPNTIGGSSSNAVTPGVIGATIWGGSASGQNRVSDAYGTVGGGAGNVAGNDTGSQSDAFGATVGGGSGNTASGNFATVGGGALNTAGAESSTVAGGATNVVSASYGAIGGGTANVASGSYAAVSGGRDNGAWGSYSFVAGGNNNTASGNRSLAAGTMAKTNSPIGLAHDGAFVWADSNTVNFHSAAPNEFAARSTGGFRFVTAIDGSGNPTRTTAINPNGELDFGSTTRQMLRLWGGEAYGIGIQADTLYQRSNKHYAWYVGGTHDDAMLASGSSGVVLMTLTNGSVASPPAVTGIARAQAFTATSDRAAKESFETIDSNELLDALSKMPVQSWKYRNEDQTVRHIGPTAQDFRAAFGVGYDDKTIATVDADGVALAAIQGLHKMVKEKDEKIRKLEAALEEIRARLGMK